MVRWCIARGWCIWKSALSCVFRIHQHLVWGLYTTLWGWCICRLCGFLGISGIHQHFAPQKGRSVAPASESAPPQSFSEVAKAFSMPDEVGSFQAGVAAKRINLRHLHWLKRHTTTSKKNMGWRPRKRYRISTRHWILAKDNMLKVCTRFNGLQAFARGSQADDAWSRASWKTWPHLNLAQDQGPDGFSAVMALKYKPELKCNITEWWDESHGCASVGRDWGGTKTLAGGCDPTGGSSHLVCHRRPWS